MSVEERKAEIKQIVEEISRQRGKFFTINNKGKLVMNIRPEILQEIRRLIDRAHEIDPGDSASRRRLNEAERSYQAWMEEYRKQ